VLPEEKKERKFIILNDMFLVRKKDEKNTINHVLFIEKAECKPHPSKLRAIEITRTDIKKKKKLCLEFLNDKDFNQFKKDLPSYISQAEEVGKKRKLFEGECPMCRVIIMKGSSEDRWRVCAKCNQKVCKNCCLTQIQIFAGGKARPICDNCVYENYKKQKEEKEKLKEKEQQNKPRPQNKVNNQLGGGMNSNVNNNK